MTNTATTHHDLLWLLSRLLLLLYFKFALHFLHYLLGSVFLHALNSLLFTHPFLCTSPITMPLCAITGPVLDRCCQHRTSTGPVMAHNGRVSLSLSWLYWTFATIWQLPLSELLYRNRHAGNYVTSRRPIFYWWQNVKHVEAMFQVLWGFGILYIWVEILVHADS